MRYLRWALIVGGLWNLLQAQEESRHREALSPPPPKPVQPAPKPVVKAPEVVMEMISGTLMDKNEKALANARIWLVDKATGKVLGETRSDENGNYALAVQRVETIILRVSVDGKSFMEKEYPFDTILSLSEVVFEP